MKFFQTYLLAILLVLSSSTIFSWRIHYSFHDLLEIYGLPQGIFPRNMKSYSLDQNNVLEVKLERPCLAKFESLMYFDDVVRANISKGKLWGIEGLSNKELFIWLPVKEIIVNYPEAGLVVIDITLANKTLSLSVFERPHICEQQGESLSQVLLVVNKKDGNKNELFGFELQKCIQAVLDFLNYIF